MHDITWEWLSNFSPGNQSSIKTYYLGGYHFPRGAIYETKGIGLTLKEMLSWDDTEERCVILVSMKY